MKNKGFKLSEMESIKQHELPEIKRLLEEHPGRNRAHYQLRPVKNQANLITEIKKSSPTKSGTSNISIEQQISKYLQGGAIGISVLIDQTFFSGDWKDLEHVCDQVQMPVLCKEFIYFTEQIELAAKTGADLVLLIACSLSKERLRELYLFTESLQLTPLIEVHHKDELPHVLEMNPKHILVNMRNLNTLKIDRTTGIETLQAIPESIHKISASSIHCSEDIQSIHSQCGAKTFLVGSSLMASDNPLTLIKELQHAIH